MLGFGFALIALGLALPMGHVATWSGTGPDVLAAVASSFPLLALVIAVIRPTAVMTLCLFPVSFLPALVIDPRLTGPLVYSGTSGVLALGGVTVVAAGWVVFALLPQPATLWRRQRGSSVGWLPWLVALVPLAILVAFAMPALSAKSVLDAQVTVLIGLVTAGWSAQRWLLGDLAEVWLEPRAREREIALAMTAHRVSARHVVAYLAASALAAAAVITMYAT